MLKKLNDPNETDPCLECHHSTAAGSGRWVNRTYYWRDHDDGWVCEECQNYDHQAENCLCTDCLEGGDDEGI